MTYKYLARTDLKVTQFLKIFGDTESNLASNILGSQGWPYLPSSSVVAVCHHIWHHMWWTSL